MNILVTGASGFIGSRLVRVLAGQGHEVTAVGRRQDILDSLGAARSIACDLRASYATSRFPRSVDAVVHLAQANVANANETELRAVNAMSTATVLEYAERADATSFVLTSSGSVYGGSSEPRLEMDPALGSDPYARSKLEAERLVTNRRGDFAAIVLRLFAPYGPRQHGRLIPELISRVRSSRPVTLRAGGRPRLNPIYIDHVIDVLAQALVPPPAPIVNVAGDVVLSVRDMAQAIGRVVGMEPIFEDEAETAQEDLIGDTTMMRRHFNLPTPLIGFEQGIAAIVRDEGRGRSST